MRAQVDINRFELDGTVFRRGDVIEVDEGKFPTTSLIYLEPVVPPDEVKPKKKVKPRK